MDEELVRIVACLLAYPHAYCPRCGQQAMLELMEQVGHLVQQSRVPETQKRLLADWLQLLHRLVRQYSAFSDAILIDQLKQHATLRTFVPLLPQLAIAEPAPSCALYYAQKWVRRYGGNRDDRTQP